MLKESFTPLGKFDLNTIDAHFPKEQYREGQKEAIEFALNAYNDGKKVVILECPTGSGKCLDADTLVLDSHGQRIRIADLGNMIGRNLHSLDSNLQNSVCKLTSHCCSGPKECFKITTLTGRSVISTIDHRFLIFNEWKPLRLIKVGDYLAVNRSLQINNSTDYISETEAELLGLLLGDGNFSTRHRVRICISDNEPEIFARTSQLIKLLDPELELRTAADQTRIGKNYEISRNISRANVGAPEYVPNVVNDFINTMGLSGVVKDKKFIPKEVFSSSPKIWKSLLLGLWESDGWATISKTTGNRVDSCTIGFSNISYNLAQGCQHLLLRFGISSRLRFRKMLCTTSGKRHPSYQVEVRSGSILRFLQVFGKELLAVGCPIILAAELRTMISNRNKNRNSDSLIPGSIWKDIEESVSLSGMSWYAAAPIQLRKSGPALFRKRQGCTNRTIVKNFGITTKNVGLQVLGDSDVIWDPIVSIEPIGIRDTYDIQVTNDDGTEPNFSANDIITHNSAIGMTISDMVRTSYYLTVTKILQDQLVGDFGDQIVELKGRSAYPCTYWDRFGDKLVSRKLMSSSELETRKKEHSDCANGFCKTKYNNYSNKFKCTQCFTPNGPVKDGTLTRISVGKDYSECPYYEQVHQAINNRKVVMNFSSFLYQTQMTKRFDNPRDLLSIDECHNAEPQLLDFVSLKISDYHLQQRGIFIPHLDNAYEYALWFEDSKILSIIMEVYKEALEKENNRLADDMGRLIKKYQTFMEQVSGQDFEWVSEFEEKKSSGKSHRSVVLRPVFATNFVQPLLFKYAKRILMMSATVLDVGVMCKSLGLDKKHVAAYRMKNRFPVKNRPIFLTTVGKMTGGKGRMYEWAPALTKEVNKIASKYPDKKGIIHTHNFAIMDYILRHCDKNVKSRFLDQRDFKDKSEMLKKHEKPGNSIIVAPAMHEGLDLIDELSRFQIIAKIPYANCFDDAQLARRVELDRKYYTWLTALKLIQSTGRSVRSIDDYADTYILDESIYKFLKDAKKMIPSWFTEAIIDKT